MSKVSCFNCDSDNIVIVNELIEKKEKEGAVFFAFLYAILYLVIFICFFILLKGNFVEGARALYVLIGSLSFLILVYIFRLLQPFRYENKIKCICLDCGSTWYLEDNNNPN